VWPSKEAVDREAKALDELNYSRQRLLDALFTHSKHGKGGG
jgi:hypothetical protein